MVVVSDGDYDDDGGSDGDVDNDGDNGDNDDDVWTGGEDI